MKIESKGRLRIILNESYELQPGDICKIEFIDSQPPITMIYEKINSTKGIRKGLFISISGHDVCDEKIGYERPVFMIKDITIIHHHDKKNSDELKDSLYSINQLANNIDEKENRTTIMKSIIQFCETVGEEVL